MRLKGHSPVSCGLRKQQTSDVSAKLRNVSMCDHKYPQLYTEL